MQGYLCLSILSPIKHFKRNQLYKWEQLSIFWAKIYEYQYSAQTMWKAGEIIHLWMQVPSHESESILETLLIQVSWGSFLAGILVKDASQRHLCMWNCSFSEPCFKREILSLPYETETSIWQRNEKFKDLHSARGLKFLLKT